MIKTRYLVQIGYAAEIEESDPNAKSLEEIEKATSTLTKTLEEHLTKWFFDTEHGEKLIVTEILNEVTKE